MNAGTKPTPGPWKINDFKEIEGSGVIIGRVYERDEDAENGKLIAAAPDLLEAAREALRLLEALEAGDGSLYPGTRGVLIAAIKRATV